MNEEINLKLDLIIKLLGAKLVNNKEYRDQVQILKSLGLKNKEIGSITGKTENNIKVTLHNIKKQEVKKK